MNEAGFGQVPWELTRQIGFGIEATRWRTAYLGAGATSLWRVDSVSFFRF